MGHRISTVSFGASEGLMGRRGADFFPILKNPSATRRRLERCRARATGRSPASTLVSGIDDFVDAARHLTRMHSTHYDRVHLFGSGTRIHGESPRWMRSDAAGLLETGMCCDP